MKRLCSLIIVFFFQGSILFGQTTSIVSGQARRIDSFNALLKSDKEDTNKVNHLNKLAVEFAGNPGVDTVYIKQAFTLAKKLHYLNGIGDAYRGLGWAYWTRLKNNTLALDYFFKAEDTYIQSGNLTEQIRLYSHIGYVYYGMDSFATALKYEFKALKLNENLKNAYFLASIPDNIGDAYTALGDYPDALKYYMDALRYIEESSNEKRISNYLENIGTLYVKMKDYKNAMNYFDSALTKSQKIKYISVQKSALLDIGITYKAENKFTEALDYISKAYQLSQHPKDQVTMSKCLEVTGEIYKEEGDYAKALEYEKEALNNGEESKFLPVTIKSRGVIGEIYLKQKNYKEAETYLLAAIASVHGSHEPEEEKNYELDMSQLYSATGELKKSLACYAKYDSLKDSLITRDKSRQLGKIEAKAEYDKQLAAQQAEEANAKALANAKSKRQQIINLLVALIALIITLIAILIYRSWRAAKKEKKMVEKEKILLELKALRAQMNPHFIFNAINSIQNFILDNDTDAAQKHLSRFSKLMRMVLENSSYENIPLADEIKMLELYLEFETVRFSSRFRFKIMVDESIDINNTFISPLLIQPYVENAVWHGLMHLKGRIGEVVIHFETQNNQLKCTIDDNGIGRKHSMEIKKGSVHKSMGLSITAERLEIINTLFKSKMSVNFTDKTNADGTSAGTKVELLMPIISNARTHA